jgi:hypothetical protein
MKIFSIYLIFFFLISTGTGKSQIPVTDTSQRLEGLFDRLIDNYVDTDRVRINDSIRLIIDDYVKSDSVFTFRFTNLRYLGQIVSPDSSMMIITWNLVLEDEPGKYFCYFIRKQGAGNPNKIYRLSVSYNEKPVETDTIYTESNWYGALYYDLRPFNIDNKQCWILLGIDYSNTDISSKIIEVLSFKPDDSIVFGRKWFESGGKKKYRAVFEYASNAMMSLRFRSDSSIVFDHLVPFSSSHKDQHQYYGPDYSFDAYNFENGLWKLVLNVDVRNDE